MDIVMPLLLILAIINGCTGMDPRNMEWTPKLKQKLFEVFHRTFPNTSEHSQRMLDLWNRENPLHKVSDHNALQKLAMSLIRDKTRKLKYPEMGQIEWPREMKVDLLYICNKDVKEKGKSAADLKAKWKLFYPYRRLNAETLALYSQYLQDEKFQPTEEELRMAKEKYDRVIAENKKRIEDLKARRPPKMSKKPQIRWSPQLKTDLWYISQQLETVKLPLSSNLKVRWNQMNEEYNFTTEDALYTSLKSLRYEGFVPKAEDVENTKARYDKLPPIIPQDLKSKKRNRRKDKLPIEVSQPNSHKSHHPDHQTPPLEHHEPSSSHLVDHTYRQSIGGSDTAGAISSYSLGDYGPGDKVPSPSQFHQYEVRQQHLDDPIYSPSSHGDFSYDSAYDLHPLIPSFNPYLYHSSHDPGESSSRGQNPPQP